MPLDGEWRETAKKLFKMGGAFYPTQPNLEHSSFPGIFGLHDGKVAGALLYMPFFEGKHRTLFISYVSVDPMYHKKGIGEAMVNRACAEAIKHEAKRIEASVKDTNAASTALMKKCGFKVVKSEAGHLTFSKRAEQKA